MSRLAKRIKDARIKLTTKLMCSEGAKGSVEELILIIVAIAVGLLLLEGLTAAMGDDKTGIIGAIVKKMLATFNAE